MPPAWVTAWVVSYSPWPVPGLGQSPRALCLDHVSSAWLEPVVSETDGGLPPAPSLACGLPPCISQLPLAARTGLTYLVALVDAIDELGAGGAPGEADGRGIGGFCTHIAGRDRGDWRRAEKWVGWGRGTVSLSCPVK